MVLEIKVRTYVCMCVCTNCINVAIYVTPHTGSCCLSPSLVVVVYVLTTLVFVVYSHGGCLLPTLGVVHSPHWWLFTPHTGGCLLPTLVVVYSPHWWLLFTPHTGGCLLPTLVVVYSSHWGLFTPHTGDCLLPTLVVVVYSPHWWLLFTPMGVVHSPHRWFVAGGLMSVFLMGVYDDSCDKWKTVCKCGNGHDDATIMKLQKQLKMKKINKVCTYTHRH